MEADTYRRYETGQTELRVNQIVPFARAYGIAPRELSEALGLLIDGDLGGWSFREALRGHLPEDLIDDLAPEHEGEPLADQQAAVRGYLRMAERLRTAATKPRSGSGRPQSA
jgi:hypothetical protein